MGYQFSNGNIIFIGKPRVGKTALVRRLFFNDDFLPTESATQGIDINQYELSDENDKKIRVSVTDFGGQSIFYSLYPMFFRDNSVYVYVHDTRREVDIEFWLSQINMNSKNSFIIVVQNQIDAYPIVHLNQAYLQSKYPNIISFVNTSALTNQGINELKDFLLEAIKKSKIFDLQIPSNWSTIISEIIKLRNSHPYITSEVFKELCLNHHVNDAQYIDILAFLNDMGIILYFQNDLMLNSIILLDMGWLLRGACLVLSSNIIVQEKGILSIDQIQQILEDYSNYEQTIFITFLLLFQLSYKIEKGSFLFPIGLSNTQALKEWDFEKSYKFEYQFLTNPLGLIERFIVRNYERIDIKNTWRHGVVINFEDSKALLVSDTNEKKVKVWIISDTPQEILNYVSLEIERLLNSYAQVDFKKLIPCTCEACKNSDEPNLYDFELLKKHLSNGNKNVTCNISYSEVDINHLLFNPLSKEDKIEDLVEKIEILDFKQNSNIKYEWNNLNNLLFEVHFVENKQDVFKLFYAQCKDLNSKIINSNLYILEFEKSKAKIENDLVNLKIKITLEGEYKEDLLAILRHKFHGISIDKNEFKKFIKCNCIDCLNESFYFNFDFLRQRELKGKDFVICGKSANDVSITELLGRQGSKKDYSGIIIVQNQQNLNDMKIENQNIYGGNQQFADLIINKSHILNETDTKFLQLIHENTSSPEERQALVESLENIKSSDTQIDEKKKSGGFLRKFLDSIATEGGKQLVKEIFKTGTAYLPYIFPQ